MKFSITRRHLLASLMIAAATTVAAKEAYTHTDTISADGLAQADIAVRCKGEWTLIWDYTDSANYNYAAIKTRLVADDIYGGRSTVSVHTITEGQNTLVGKQDVEHQTNMTGLRLTRSVDGRVRLVAGDNTPVSFKVPFNGIPGSRVSISAPKGIVYQNIELSAMVHDEPAPFGSIDELDKYLASSKDSIEGIWEYQDRNMPAGKIVPGGKYELAVVRLPDSGSYSIYYLSGGKIYADRWRMFMRKGTLIPTVFNGNFDMEWVDASRARKLAGENYATLTIENSLLTLYFPLINTTMRFRRKL